MGIWNWLTLDWADTRVKVKLKLFVGLKNIMRLKWLIPKDMVKWLIFGHWVFLFMRWLWVNHLTKLLIFQIFKRRSSRIISFFLNLLKVKLKILSKNCSKQIPKKDWATMAYRKSSKKTSLRGLTGWSWDRSPNTPTIVLKLVKMDLLILTNVSLSKI